MRQQERLYLLLLHRLISYFLNLRFNFVLDADIMTTSQPQEQRQKGLPDVQRIITDHNSDGKAVVSTDIPSQAVWQPIGPAADFFLGYTTRTFPVGFKDAQDSESAPLPQDIKTYKEDMITPPGLTISTGKYAYQNQIT
jgi:hypothetical protein